jgi:hypothetical protein
VAIPVASWSQTALGNGTYCQIVAPMPQAQQQAGGQFSCQAIDLATYLIVVGAGATATATFQALGGNGTWFALVSPAPISLTAATSFNGIVNGPYHGLRLVITAIAGGTLSYVELIGSIRSL